MHETMLGKTHQADFAINIPSPMGVAVYSGPLLLGTVGNEKRLKCDVVGDAVNLCSRLEALTRNFNTSMLISKETAYAIQGDYTFRDLGKVSVKGKIDPIHIVEILEALPTSEKLSRLNSLGTYTKALSDYQSGNIEEAGIAFKQLHEETPSDGAAKLYYEKCLSILENKTIESELHIV